MTGYRRETDGTLTIIDVPVVDGEPHGLTPCWAVGDLLGVYPGHTPEDAIRYAAREAECSEPDLSVPTAPATVELRGWPNDQARIWETDGGVEVLLPEQD